ncbi:MAG TPA: XTP/dITP diphosphatase [Deltaproteobacteria bacterium]|nr:XTP/dITP diphosphatase [Deltaproteobacteria bacterium]
MKLVIATRNPGKAREIKAILSDADLTVLTLDDFPGLELPPEDGATFEENALIKARHVAERTGLAALADDSGIEVDALGGRPGVYSARYAGPGATDEENNRKLVEELRGVDEARRTARYRCVVALVTPEGLEKTFSGAFEGRIVLEPRGSGGFGYDPYFFVPSRRMTAAQLPPDEKNRLSHRAEALRKLKAWLGHGAAGLEKKSPP